MNPQLLLVIPLILLLVAYIGFCWMDIYKAPRTKYLPKYLWALICLLSIPLGGIIYFIVGKDKDIYPDELID